MFVVVEALLRDVGTLLLSWEMGGPIAQVDPYRVVHDTGWHAQCGECGGDEGEPGAFAQREDKYTSVPPPVPATSSHSEAGREDSATAKDAPPTRVPPPRHDISRAWQAGGRGRRSERETALKALLLLLLLLPPAFTRRVGLSSKIPVNMIVNAAPSILRAYTL
ncbi:hypothetical protein DFH11DRAFT_1733927 [Phellopilus nigrolimitatus]|nr:hypothetical protein DFH11DRAFT_1733927 [Phellopilus nigrolimitatus]